MSLISVQLQCGRNKDFTHGINLNTDSPENVYNGWIFIFANVISFGPPTLKNVELQNGKPMGDEHHNLTESKIGFVMRKLNQIAFIGKSCKSGRRVI